MLTPDPSFERALRRYDDELRIRWNDRAKRWVIGRMVSRAENEGERFGATWHCIRRRFHPIFHVETEERGFRQPGQDTIAQIAMMDLCAGGGSMTAAKQKLIAELAAQEQRLQDEGAAEMDALVTQEIAPAIIRSNTPSVVVG